TTPISTTPLNGTTAALNTSALAVGTHSITAEYLGDGNFTSSTSSPAVSETVNQASTTTALAVDQNPSAYGQSVTFTASVTPVSPGAGVATGTVTFKDGTTVLGYRTLGSNGIATFSTSALAVGSHSITTTYGGDTNFVGSASASLSETVDKNGVTMVTVTSSADPSVLNQPVIFTVTVSAAKSSGIPTGKVQFQIDGTNFGTAVSLSNGSATSRPIQTLKLGNHTITAAYSGDANFAASTSPGLTQV